MTASTVSRTAFSWTTNLSPEQEDKVNFCAAASNQPPEEILEWLQEINWDQTTISNKLDQITSGASEGFGPNWQSRRKKKKKHSETVNNASTANTGTPQSKKPRNNPKSSPAHGPGARSRKERRQNRDKVSESKPSNGGGRRSEKKRANKKSNYHQQFRAQNEKDVSTSQAIQSVSGMVSGDASYAERVKPADATSGQGQESQSSASTPSLTSRTPSAQYGGRLDPPATSNGSSYHHPKGKSSRAVRRGYKSGPNDRERGGYRGTHDDSFEPRDQHRPRVQYDRYNQYSHPDEVPPRHARRPGRHVNGSTRKHSNHYNNSSNGQFTTTMYRPSNQNDSPGRRHATSRDYHERDPYEGSKSLDLEESTKPYFATNGSTENYERDSGLDKRRPPGKYPTATLDLTTAEAAVSPQNPELRSDLSGSRNQVEAETSSEKSDRSITNMPNTVLAQPAVTPIQPAYPFGSFPAEYKARPKSDEVGAVNGDFNSPVENQGVSHTTADSGNRPTRPPIHRQSNSGMSGLSSVSEKSHSFRANKPDHSGSRRDDPVAKRLVFLPQEVEETKDVDADFSFGRHDFGATENTVQFVGNLEARMERGFEDEKFDGVVGIPYEFISEAELSSKSESELIALFSQFVRSHSPFLPTTSSARHETPSANVSSTGATAPATPTGQRQPQAQPSGQTTQEAGTPTSSHYMAETRGKSGTSTVGSEKGPSFDQGNDLASRDMVHTGVSSAPLMFGRHGSSQQSFGNNAHSNRSFERKTPDSQSPEQYMVSQNVGVATHGDQPMTQSVTAFSSNAFNRMPSNGSASYSPNMGTQSNMIFRPMQTGSSALVGSGFIHGQSANGQIAHTPQQVVPPTLAPQQGGLHQPQAPHLHGGHFGGHGPPQFQPMQQRQHSHPGMQHGHMAHNGHLPGPPGNPMGGQPYPMPMADEDRYPAMPNFHRNFQQAQAPPPPQHTHSGPPFMHQLPQGNMGMHPPPNTNPQLPPPSLNGHLGAPGMPQFGGGMNHGPAGPPGPRFGHGPPPMFAQPQPGPTHPPPMQPPAHPPQLMGHNMGPQHAQIFDQPYSEFVGPGPYTQNRPWPGTFENGYC